jgi:hypothetical protein
MKVFKFILLHKFIMLIKSVSNKYMQIVSNLFKKKTVFEVNLETNFFILKNYFYYLIKIVIIFRYFEILFFFQ